MAAAPSAGSSTGVALLGTAEIIGVLMFTSEGKALRAGIMGSNTSGMSTYTALRTVAIAVAAVIVATMIAGTSKAAAHTMFVILLALGFVFVILHVTGQSILPGTPATTTPASTTPAKKPAARKGG